MNERESLIALNTIPGISTIRINKLLSYFGSAKKVLQIDPSKLVSMKLIPQLSGKYMRSFDAEKYILEECKLLKKEGIDLITQKDEVYPKNLQKIPDAPLALYCKGNIPEENELSIAIVGSRKASIYGLSMAEKFACELAQLGITIVSGMARGIDAAAHRGALRARGTTIAVLGSGLSNIYPPEHEKLFNEIVNSGAVISEFSMNTKPLAYNFPRRNRIVSGISLGVIVVEASKKSGALITSDCALEQGREVFAIPGKIDSPNSQGVNSLIKQGAKLVSSVEDIIEELQPQLRMHTLKKAQVSSKKTPGISLKNLTEEEIRAYNSLGIKPIHIDNLSQKLKMSQSQIMSVLLHLELKKLIKQFPGKLFAKAS